MSSSEHTAYLNLGTAAPIELARGGFPSSTRRKSVLSSPPEKSHRRGTQYGFRVTGGSSVLSS